MALPDAGSKLRMVLDYLPCEACLAQPVADQELLCTICARLDREVAVRVGTRTTVLFERPTPVEAPIVIPPAPPMPAAPPAPREVVVRWADEPSTARAGAIEIVVEPLLPPVAPAPEAEPTPVVALAAEPEVPEEPGFSVDDIAEYLPPASDYFDFQRSEAGAYARPRPAAPARAPEPEPAPPRAPPREEPPQDDFVFRPPSQDEEPVPPPPPPVEEELLPAEEVAVESPEAQEQWAPPADLLADEPVEPLAPEPPPQRVEEVEEVQEAEEVVEMELVEDDEVMETELVEDEPEAPPAPAPSATGSDLYRLRGFDEASERALGGHGITAIAHLSGHDAGELAQRTGIPFDRVVAWVQVADLVQEVGVPIDAAVALVAAGVAGPRGLRDADAEEVADRVAAFGGYTVNARDVARWKRRA